MRTIELTNLFRRDYRRVVANARHRQLDLLLDPLMEMLARDELLEARLRDHLLTGTYKGHRVCHLKPDLLVIYAKPGETKVLFGRPGSIVNSSDSFESDQP